MKKLSIVKNKWAIVAVILAFVALAASLTAGYYYLQYNDIKERTGGVLIYVNVGFDYGNNTRTYYNDTKALTGETLFDVTKQVANVYYQVSAYGTYITGINGVNATSSGYGWTYFSWNSTGNTWSMSLLGVDSYYVTNGQTFLWYYQNGFNLPPP